MATPKPLNSRTLTASTASALFMLGMSSANAAPQIRTNAQNEVPACVTPERLMAFLMERNPNLDPRFREIARWYKYYGEGWHVRWDYAFYQMVLETNYLSYRRGDGRRGDVRETQNNFAGIGATGGGVRGERFADVKTGVHAQIQHLVAYSGEHVAVPVAKRTRENQDDIIKLSNRLGRPMTFGDLARRWATDRAYGKSIDIVSNLYRARYCAPPAQAAESEPSPPQPLQIRREWRYPFRPPSGLGGPMPDDEGSGDAVPSHAKSETPGAPSRHDRPIAVAPKKAALKASKHVAAKTKMRASAQKTKTASHAKTASHTSTSISSWASGTAVQHETIVAKDAEVATPLAQPPEQVAENSERTGFLAWLPTFRITPEPPQPSRLGGPLPADLGVAAKAAEDAPLPPCRVLTATYGGRKTLLIRSRSGAEVQYTALTIMDGFEKPMFDAYARTEAVGAEIVGEYSSPESALIDAKVNCPVDN